MGCWGAVFIGLALGPMNLPRGHCGPAHCRELPHSHPSLYKQAKEKRRWSSGRPSSCGCSLGVQAWSSHPHERCFHPHCYPRGSRGEAVRESLTEVKIGKKMEMVVWFPKPQVNNQALDLFPFPIKVEKSELEQDGRIDWRRCIEATATLYLA